MEEAEFAGDRLSLVENADGSAVLRWDDKGIGRSCGDCQLCCKLLPIPGPPLFKPAGQRCAHQRVGKGCTIYPSRPRACRSWSCRWMADPSTAKMPRPDRAHYVIDLIWDDVTMEHTDGSTTKVPALQVWADPAFPQAHKAPELRAYMEYVAKTYGAVTVVRWGKGRARTFIPPALAKDGKWWEIASVGEDRDPAPLQISEIGYVD